MNRARGFFADIVFPNRCPFCGGFIPWNAVICDNCGDKIQRADFCPKCGMCVCECGDTAFHYDGCAVVIPYIDLGRDGVLALKYHAGFNAAEYLIPELTEKLKSHGFLTDADIITAVPMTKARRELTGYNHAEYIAKLISKAVNLQCDFKLIGKRKTAPLQHELSREERAAAAKETYFPLKRELTGKTVILCDDIITTGSTLSACAGVLKKMGAKAVYCAVLAGSYLKE